MTSPRHSFLTHLDCPVCRQSYPADQLQTYCHECDSPLAAAYDLEALRAECKPSDISRRTGGMWRWWELLPLRDPAYRVSLGEGGTPLIRLARLGESLGVERLWIKEEGLNPTGTFKARGLSAAVSKARELGASGFVIPTAGNAGGALAAYAARAGLPAHVYMPADAPLVHRWEVEQSGAHLVLVDGLIDEAGRLASKAAGEHGWFNLATFREPYRLEGKKTLGLELAEAFGWELPQVIVYPTGGGTGLVGMWKAFEELKQLGWISGDLPRMVSVQAAGCAPIVRAIERGAERAEPWDNAATYAGGLRVPKVFADRLILEAIRSSGGTAVAVTEAEIELARRQLVQIEGVLACPEGAATLAGLVRLLQIGSIDREESIVIYNTGTGMKHLLDERPDVSETR